MSQDDQDVGAPVKRLFAAFSARDWEVFAAQLDPNVEYTPVEEQTLYRGPQAVTQYVLRWLEMWDPSFSGEAEEIERASIPNRLFVKVRFRGRGKGSGVDIDDTVFWAVELRDGRLYRISEYTRRAEALEALGLSE